jgi:protein CMS1
MSDSDDDQAGVPLIEDISSSDNDQATKKRKRSNEDSAEAKKAARKKKRTLKKPKDIEDESLDAELGVNHAIAHMDSRLLVDHLAQRTKRFKPDLSLMELEDMFVPGKMRCLESFFLTHRDPG